tara:strand:+ start:594 stop:839 length:246 start_codon:yes stop_codon:yes gene_type:complete
MALKCLQTVVVGLSESVLKNAGKRKGSDYLLGSKQHSLLAILRAGLMRQNLMSTNTGCIQFAKRLDAQTYTIVGVEELQLS